MTDDDGDGTPHGGRHAEAAGGAGPAGDGGASTTGADGEALSPAMETIEELADRAAAGAGFVVAAFAFVAATLPWTEAPPFVPSIAGAGSTLAAVLAAVATVAFFARRHGALGRRPGAAVAGAASAGVVLVALARFLAPVAGGGDDPVVGIGLPLALVTGALAVALAVADDRDVSAAGLVERARRTGVGFGLLVGAFVLQSLVVVLVVSAHTALGSPFGTGPLGPNAYIVASVLLADTVFAGVALLFLRTTGRGLAYVDLAWPDLRDVAYGIAGFVGIFVVFIGLSILRTLLQLPATSNRITDAARSGHPETLLVLVPLTILFVAPAEELLNRNVIQKYLYGTFSRAGAIVVASGIFAVAHVFSYSGDSVAAMAVSMTSIFLLSLVLGAIYERTENILVPIVVHGAFNAVQFLLLYVVIVYMPDAATQATALPW